MFRIILVALFAAIPLSASAQVPDGLLGPSSTSNGQSVGPSSNQGSNLLQPASKSDGESLQSTGTNGVTQSPDQSALQRPASADEAKLFISGDVDTEEDTSETNLMLWAVICALALGVVVVIVFIFRNKLRLPQLTAYQQTAPAASADESVDVEKVDEPVASKPKTSKKKKKSSKKKSSKRKSK